MREDEHGLRGGAQIASDHVVAKVVLFLDGSAGPALLAKGPRALRSEAVDRLAVPLREKVRP